MKTLRNGKVISGTIGNASEVNYKGTTVAAVLDNMSAADLDKVITEENLIYHTFPPEEHDHDERYYTKEEIDNQMYNLKVNPTDTSKMNIWIEIV